MEKIGGKKQYFLLMMPRSFFSECKENCNIKRRGRGTDILVAVALYNNITKEVAGQRREEAPHHAAKGQNTQAKETKRKSDI